MKVFVGLTEIAGYYGNLKRGLEQLGVECTFIDLNDHPFEYSRDVQANILTRLLKKVLKKRLLSAQSHLIVNIWWKVLCIILRISLFCWAFIQYDVFIFGFASSFLSFYDLPILKCCRRRIIYVFHGSDSRPPYIDGYMKTIHGDLETGQYISLIKRQKEIVAKIERYADVIISHPLSSQLHEKWFVPLTVIGIPYHISHTYLNYSTTSIEHKIRILHSPSNPETKGTLSIRHAIEKLRAKGYGIEFIEISGEPNVVVLEEIARCDFVVDQLYSDTMMAGFATEAAFLGKPSVVAGYAESEVRRIFAADKIPPVHYCHPNEIEEAIEQLIVNREYRAELGARAKAFVETNWAPKKVAERYLQLIEGNMPQDWLYDPKDIVYLHGYGLSESSTEKFIKALIQDGGIEALQITDKPELARRFLQFACREAAC
jgi:hypothetical protein